MKKFTLLLLAAFAGMGTLSAENVTIYLDPSTNTNWTSNSARFALALYKDGENLSWVSFTQVQGQSYYSATVDTEQYNQFYLCRMNGNTAENSWENKWNQTPASDKGVLPTKDAYLRLTNTGWDGAEYNVSLLPWAYYFYGNLNGGTDWHVGEKLVENDGTFTGTLSAQSGDNFIVIPGNHVNYYSGYLWDNDSWNGAIRPSESKTIDFANYSGSTITGGSNNWYVNTTNEGTVTVSISPANNTYYISCAKSATIGAAGYATYSNGEMFTVEGAEKLYVATGKDETSVTLTVVDASTIFPAGAGLLMKGSGGITVNAVAETSTASAIDTNYFVGSGNSSLEVTDVTNAYVFSWDGSNTSTVGFYAASGSGTIGAHKAYLKVPSQSGSRGFLSFNFVDGATGISEINTAQGNNVIYNLQGVRQNELQKGINIVNGKKIMVK